MVEIMKATVNFQKEKCEQKHVAQQFGETNVLFGHG
jgi:hypothetical protein